MNPRANHKRNKESHLIKVGSILLSLNLLFSAQVPALALSGKQKKDLQKLEIKFFEHKYKKETDEKRIERLEKLVFGEAKSGDEEERIEALVATVPELNNQPSPGSSSQSTQESSPAASTQSTDSSTDTATADPSVDYPRVDAIEQTMLGKVYKSEPLGKRLDQLELKAFKKSSHDPDLSKRVDHLEKYVSKHYHKSVSQMVDPRNGLNYSAPLGNTNSAYRAPAYVGGGSGSYGMTPPPVRAYSRQAPSDRPPSLSAPVTEQLAWLENHVYGHSYPQKPLIERVRALEKTVFPSEPPDTSSSIPMQVKVLVNAVALMHRSNGTSSGAAPNGSSSTASNSSQFPNWPPKSSNATYGAYASHNQVGANYNSGRFQQPSYSAPSQSYQSQGQSNQYPSQAYQSPQSQYGNNTSYQNQSQTQYQQPRKKHGHPFLKGLAKSLLTVGAVAAGSMLGGGYYGGYGGGYGGYGLGGLNRGYGGGYGSRGLYY